MSKYVENNLNNGEQIVLKAKINWLALIPVGIWFTIVFVLAIVGSVYIGKAVDLVKEGVSGEEGGWLASMISSMTGGQGLGEEFDAALGKASGILNGVIWGLWALIAFLPLLFKILGLASISIAITNRRVIGKVGIIGIKTVDYPVEKVDNIKIEAGVFGNLLKYHTLSVLGGGNGEPIAFKGIGNATMFKNTFTEALEKHHEEARKAQADEIARAMGTK